MHGEPRAHVLAAIERGLGARDWGEVTSAEADGDLLVLGIRIPGDDRRFGIRVAAPWSGQLQPWLYMHPEDGEHWGNQLMHWLQENIDTGAAHWAVLTEADGVHWFTPELYGLRHRDAAEHARLLELAPLWLDPAAGWGGEPAEATGFQHQTRRRRWWRRTER